MFLHYAYAATVQDKDDMVFRYTFCLIGLLCLPLLGGCPRSGGPIAVSGTIEARTATAGSRVGGRVVEVFVEEGDPIETGDTLVQLDDGEARALLLASEAQVAAREAMVAKLEAGATPEQLRQAEAAAQVAKAQLDLALKGARNEEIRAANAALDATQAQREVARKEFARIQNLLSKEVASQRQFDQAKAALDAAEAQYRGAREQRDLVLSGARNEEIAMARAASEQAQAMLAELEAGARIEDIAAANAARDGAIAEQKRALIGVDEMRIVAPQRGIVESLDVRPGDLVRPGPVVRVVDPEDLEVTIYVGAGMLGHLGVGQAVTFTADAFSDATFSGEIRRISSEGEYTPRNLQTQEERVQQVFGVTLGLDTHGGRLRPGMTISAQLPRTHESG
jgi:HlyD family secretion protein